MQYLVIAWDGTDADALNRRLAAREAHLDGVKALKAEGKLLVGGAILDDEGKMIGSSVIVDFPSRADLDAWLQNDPYTKGNVWQRVEVRPFRAAPV